MECVVLGLNSLKHPVWLGSHCRSFITVVLATLFLFVSSYGLMGKAQKTCTPMHACRCRGKRPLCFYCPRLILLLLLFLKPAAQARAGKTKLYIKCFRNLTITCATENWGKHNSLKQPTVALHPWTQIVFWCQIKCREGHSSFEPGPAGNALQIGTFTPWYFKQQSKSCGCSSSMLNSSRSRRKLAE